MSVEAQVERVENRIEGKKNPNTVKDLVRELREEQRKGRIYLNVPKEEKNAAKAVGAKWDNSAKKWYAPEGADMEKLAQWQQPPTSAASQNQSDSQRMRM